MPQLADTRHEIFAMQVAGGCSLTEATKRAGFKSGNANNGSRLAKRPDVRNRIDELRSASIQASADAPSEPSQQFIEKPFVITQTVSIHELARRDKQYATCLNCLRLLAQMGGWLSDGTGRNSANAPKTLNQFNFNNLTSTQLHEILRGESGGLPANERRALLAAVPELADIEGPATEGDASETAQGE